MELTSPAIERVVPRHRETPEARSERDAQALAEVERQRGERWLTNGLEVWTRGCFHIACQPATDAETRALVETGWELVWADAPTVIHGWAFAALAHLAPIPHL